MDPKSIIFNIQQFNRLFPFYILIDKNLKIQSFGKSLKKICKIKTQDSFDYLFKINKPDGKLVGFKGLKSITEELVELEYKPEKLRLVGQFEYFEEQDEILFIGSPKLEAHVEVEEKGLEISDFANHDSLTDLLQTLNVQNTSTDEIQELLLTVQRQKNYLKGINVFAANMLNQESLDDIVWTIIDDAISRFNLEDCVVYLVDEENQTLVQRAAYGFKQKKNHEIYNPILIKMGKGIVGKVALTGKPMLVHDTTKYPEYIIDDKIRHSELTVPIIADNKVIGIIDSEHSSMNYFTEQHLTDFTTIANLTAIKIKNALIREKQVIIEKSLEENRKRFKLIVENASEAIYEMNLKGYFTYANPVFFSQMGYTLEELVEKRYWEIVQESYKDQVKAFYQKQFYQKQTESYLEFPVVTKNGTVIWVGQNVKISFNNDGSLKNIIAIARDISKRKKIEDSVLKKQKILQGITLATEELLTNSNLGDAINNSLKILGKAVDVNRTYVFKNTLDSKDDMVSSMIHEWVSDGISPSILNHNTTNVPVSEFANFLPLLLKKEHFEAIVSQLADEINIKKVYNSLGIKSVLIVPVFHRKKFWGFIGYDDCVKERHWLNDEVLLLKSFGDSLSGALEINDTTKDFKDMALFPLENPNPVVRIDLKGEVILINKPGELLKHAKGIVENKRLEKRIYKGLCKRLTRENHIETFEISAGKQTYLATARLSETNEYINIYFSNITKQKEGEKAIKQSNKQLKQQEEKYRNIISNMNLGLLEVDNNDVIQFCNQGFTEMSGFDLDEIKGKKAIKIIFGNNGLDQQREAIHQMTNSDSYEILTKNKRGKARWWHISHAPNFNDQGKIIGSIGIYLDISQQKQMEVDLEKALLRSHKASESKELFLANMSHEIRTPLNGVIGMIRELNKQEMPIRQKGYLNNAEKASNHLQSIVNNILEITKIEAGELILTSEHFGIHELLNDVVSILKSQAKQKQLKLYLNINENVSEAFIGDESRIRQILINLTGNAIKFTEKGEVTIKCFSLQKTSKKQELNFIIKDSGIGIAAKYQDNLFEKFQQEDPSISRKFGGTGLGLYITKQLVDLMGGSLKVKSKKGIGTEIHVCLPLPIGTLSVVPKKDAFLKNISHKNKRILLVEDNEINRAVAINALKPLKVSIKEAENGLEAVGILKKQSFDLIFMDIQMPVMSGIEATRIIREELKIKTPIIALSANAFKNEIDACLVVGMNDYVTKPFTEEDLWRMISKYSISSRVIGLTLKKENIPKSRKSIKLFDLVKLEEMSRGDRKFVKRMVDIFIKTIPINFSEIMKLYEVNDIKGIRLIAHKIKPSIGIMGINSLKQDILDLENISEKGYNKSHLKTLLDKISITLTEIISELKKLTF